jgi:hypothetical protein
VEANTQAALKPAAVTSSPVTVQQPGRLSLAASATPAQVSAGLQQISLSLSVQNTGEADMVLDALPLPSVTSTGSASANVATSPASTAGTVLPGGATRTFNWTWNVGGVGTVSFTASATGRDGNSANAVAPAPAPAGPVTVQTSGALSLSIAASPTQVSAGLQQVSVTLSATNTGGASVVLNALTMPSIAVSGTAAAAVVSSPASPAGSALTGGATRSFVWTYAISGSGTLSFTAGASGKEGNTGNTIAPTPITSPTVVVQAPAMLSIAASATPAKASAGLQRVSFALSLSNAGGAAVRLNGLPSPVVSRTGSAAATLAAAPASPAGTLLAGGASATFTWQYDVSGSGTVSFSGSASGNDANSGTTLAPAPASAGPNTVQQPATLSVSASLNLSTVSAGLQQLQLTLNATNSGEAGLVLAALPTPSITTTGTASASIASSPASPAGSVLGGGAIQSFVWTYSVGGSGTLSFTASASGTDANAGSAVTAPAATAGPATVQKAASVAIASVSATPSLVHLGEAIDVAVAVRNDGEAAALLVQLSGVSASATAVQAGPLPAAQNVAGNGSAVFHIAFTAQSEGTFTLTSGAAGTEANAGTTISAPAVTSAAISITAVHVAITSPDNLATLQGGRSLTAVASAWNTAGAAITQLSLSATGPGTVAAPASISGTRPTVGSSFSVSANSGAAAGSTIKLVASATDAAGAIVSSEPVVITIGPPVTLALRCRPLPQINLAQGQSAEARLEAQLSDGTFADATLSAAWSSSAPGIATVSGGVVKGVAAGDAAATGTYGGVSAACPVHVAAAPSYSILPPDPILLGLSGKLQLRFVQSLPAGRPNTNVAGANWTTDNAAIATVSGGLVTGVSAGTAIIKACVATNCDTTLAVVGSSLDTGTLPYKQYAIGNAQTFTSLSLRSGSVTALADAAVGLTLNVGSFNLEAGAVLAGDGRSAPGAVSDGSITTTGEGGDGSSGAGGGGGGGGGGSNFCGGFNCGGGGASAGQAGQSAGLGTTSGGGNGATSSTGGAGAPGGGLLILSPSPGDAGGGGGGGGKGGRGGALSAGTFSSAGGGVGVLDGRTGGGGGGGGNANSGGSPGGGGGGGGGAILFKGNAAAAIRLDGLVSLQGGGGGMLRSAASASPGGAGAGGSFFIDASAGTVTGTGTISVRGGAGGSGFTGGTCGGGGGGGGGALQISAPMAGPQLVTFVEGGAGGAPCGGGQRGEAGASGVLKRP